MNPSTSQLPAVELVSRLESAGVAFRLDGDHLSVAPRERVTPEDIAELRARKAEVTAILSGADPGIQARRIAFEIALSVQPTRLLLLRPDIEVRAGTCLSCGDPTGDATKINRCWRCLAAVRLALGAAIPAGRVS